MTTKTVFAAMLSLLVLAGVGASGCQSEAHARRNEYFDKCMTSKGQSPTADDTRDCRRKAKEFSREQKEKQASDG